MCDLHYIAERGLATSVNGISRFGETMPKDANEPRKIGAVLLLIGIRGSYFFIYRSSLLAEQGAPSVTTSRVGMPFTPIVIIFSATYILFPKFAARYLDYPGQRPSNPGTALGWIFIAVCIIFAVSVAIWMQSLLKAFGYGYQCQTTKRLTWNSLQSTPFNPPCVICTTSLNADWQHLYSLH